MINDHDICDYHDLGRWTYIDQRMTYADQKITYMQIKRSKDDILLIKRSQDEIQIERTLRLEADVMPQEGTLCKPLGSVQTPGGKSSSS